VHCTFATFSEVTVTTKLEVLAPYIIINSFVAASFSLTFNYNFFLLFTLFLTELELQRNAAAASIMLARSRLIKIISLSAGITM
jgi:hypothetical protein